MIWKERTILDQTLFEFSIFISLVYNSKISHDDICHFYITPIKSAFIWNAILPENWQKRI